MCDNEESVAYKSFVGSVGIRGRPPIKWENRVQVYVKERNERKVNDLAQARRECKDKSGWRIICHGYPLGRVRRNRRQT